MTYVINIYLYLYICNTTLKKICVYTLANKKKYFIFAPGNFTLYLQAYYFFQFIAT